MVIAGTRFLKVMISVWGLMIFLWGYFPSMQVRHFSFCTVRQQYVAYGMQCTEENSATAQQYCREVHKYSPIFSNAPNR